MVTEDITWCHEGLLLLWRSADAVGSFCGSAWEVRSSEISDTAAVPWASAQLASPCWWSTGVGKKKCFFGQSVSQQRAEWVTAVQREGEEEEEVKRRTRKQNVAKKKKKVQSESLCNCSHLVLPSATAALFLLARWSGCYFMCQGELTACSCSSTLTDFSLMLLVSTVASGHSYQRPTGTATRATASNRVIFFSTLFYGCHTNPSWHYSCKSAACAPSSGSHKKFRRPVEILLLFQQVSEWVREWVNE